MTDSPSHPASPPEHPAESDDRERGARRNRRVARWLLGLALAAVTLLLILRALLPAALENGLRHFARTEAGVDLEIGNIDLRLLRGELVAERIHARWTGAPPGTPQEPAASADPRALDVSSLRLAIEWRDLLSRRVNLRELSLVSPVLRLDQRSDGSLVLPTLRDDDADAEEVAPDPEASPPWSYRLGALDVEALDFTLHPESADESAVEFTMARLAFGHLSVDGGNVGLGEISIQDPNLYVQRQWLQRQVANSGAEPDEPPPAPAPAPAAEGTSSLRVEKLDVDAADFLLRTPQGPLDLSLHLTANDFATGPGHRFPIEFGLRVEAGEVEAKFEVGTNPLFASGQVVWRDLPVPVFLMLNNPELIPWLRSCRSSGTLDLELHTDEATGPPALTARGSAQILDFALVDPNTEDLGLEWQSLDLVVREAVIPLDPTTGVARRIDFERIELTAPKIVATRPPEAVDRLMASLGGAIDEPADMQDPVDEAGTDESAQRDPTAPPPQAHIETLVVRDGKLRFVDRTVTPTHRTQIDELRLDARDVQLPGREIAAFDLRGAVRGSGPFSIEASTVAGKTTLDIEVDRLKLVPYDGFARAAGWGILAGEGSLQTDIEIAGDRYVSRNALVLHELRVNSQEPGQFAATFGISLDLALALLRQPDGDIDLRIPVAVERGETTVDLRTILFDALRQAITGALSSPLKLMGMVVLPGSGKAGGLEPILYEPGSAELRSDAEQRIAALARVAADKPELIVRLEGRTAASDRDPLALETLRETVAAGGDLPALDDAGFFATRRVRAALEQGEIEALSPEDSALLARFVEAQAVAEQKLETLAIARAEAVRDSLVADGMPADNIAVAIGDEADAPEVKVSLRARDVE